MAATNVRTHRSGVYSETLLAGGYGPRGAKQDAESQLRRLVMACLLWEDIAYADGTSVAESIRALVPQLDADTVASIAIEARFDQKLRHVPLLLCREMVRHDTHRHRVADTLAKVCFRPDEMTEFLAIYWSDNGRRTLPKQVKVGLAQAFRKFDAYQLAKYNKPGKAVALRDVLFLTHPKPQTQDEAATWKQLADKKLSPPDTWEVGLSSAKTEEEKRAVWERLIAGRKLGALAFLKNLRNMTQVGVSRSVITMGLASIKPTMLLPIDFLRAATFAPDWVREIEAVMLRCASQWPKLPGWTIFVVDVSGSMHANMSARSQFTRMDAAAAMAVLASEMCEQITVYATAGSDPRRVHATKKIPSLRGFGLSDRVLAEAHTLGGGGIFTRQCLEFIREQERETPDRIVIFSDSQDCDLPGSGQPRPFGKRNYIVDVSSHSHGVNYRGVWDAEVSGWSEHFLRFIAAQEAQCVQ